MSDLAAIHTALTALESKMGDIAKIADEQKRLTGEVAPELKSAIDNLGTKQREFADRLAALEQKGTTSTEGDDKAQTKSVGRQFVESEEYKSILTRFGGQFKGRVSLELSTKAQPLTGDSVLVAPDRRPGIVAAPLADLVIESLFPHVPTGSNLIEFTKETSFTNNAAETAEAASKPQSDFGFAAANMPVSTVAHFTRISKQLASDAPALRAYIDTRMRWGVDRRVETQLVSGDGVAPNISGFLDAGNFTAHGYAAADIGATLPIFVLLRRMIADLRSAGYFPDAVVMGAAAAAAFDIQLVTTQAGQALASIDGNGVMRVRGVPIVESAAMPADYVAVGAFRQVGTIYDREATVVDMSDSDADNFTKNLITIRAERRLALVIEQPAGIRAGDLTPA